MSPFHQILAVVFFAFGGIGFLVFLLAARAGKKVWPLWLAGVAAVSLTAFIGGAWWTSGGGDLGGVGLAWFFVIGWAGAGLVAWSLAALMVGAFSFLK